MSCGATFSVLNGGEKEQTKDKRQRNGNSADDQTTRAANQHANQFFKNEFAMRRHFCSDF